MLFMNQINYLLCTELKASSKIKEIMLGGYPRVGASHGKEGPNTDHGIVFPRYKGPGKAEVCM